ncbi:MAG: 30S ribosome-binding factor RbfA [Candidatus Izemoplasmatales bacterium]|nr:30S ribosome-binding factor RbfA [Candidatus Izemoplasmatales bacterium]MDY0138460.1 30S ribosome-binding factor RbfA [Candidatus Izemoplasmatales bacterium]
MANVSHLETTVQRVVAEILRDEVKDDLGFITITGVKITNELSFMYVYYTVYGNEKDLEKTAQTLERANGFIKNQIANRVKMRKVPTLVFKFDESLNKGRKIDDIIKKIK